MNMLAPMLLLALACVAIGLIPGLVLTPARVIAVAVAHTAWAVDGEWNEAAVRISALGLGLFAVTGAALLLRRLLAPGASARLAETWGCAAAAMTPRMQYTASSYAAPLLASFGPLAGVRQHREATAFHSHPIDPVQDGAVVPAWRALGRASVRLRGAQGGRLRWYLLSVIFTLLALLYYLTIARHTP
jgi:hypothetical protein